MKYLTIGQSLTRNSDRTHSLRKTHDEIIVDDREDNIVVQRNDDIKDVQNNGHSFKTQGHIQEDSNRYNLIFSHFDTLKNELGFKTKFFTTHKKHCAILNNI